MQNDMVKCGLTEVEPGYYTDRSKKNPLYGMKEIISMITMSILTVIINLPMLKMVISIFILKTVFISFRKIA
jgi:hypothetical protein